MGTVKSNLKYTPLPGKRVKEIRQILSDQFGFEEELDYQFFSNEEKIYIVSREIINVPLELLRINSIGMYFGEINERGHLRLSIEGAQMVGPKATKNIVEIDEPHAKLWMKGEEFETDVEADQFVLIKSGNDFLGTGKPKNGKMLNFVPKARRVSMD